MPQTAVHSITIEGPACPLEAFLEGPENGTLVVLLHGFPDTPHSWQAVSDLLISQGYRVLRPWLRGYTTASSHSKLQFGVMPAVEDLSAWMKHLKPKHAHLVGHDWGSLIAQAHASEFPKQWRSLSLLAVPPFEGLLTSPLTTWKQVPAQMKLSAYMWAMQNSESAPLLAADDCEKVRELWKSWSPTWNFTEQDFAPVKAVFSDEQLGWAATRYYRSLFTLHRLKTLQTLKRAMSKLTVPTLVLAGEDDGCMGRPFQEVMFKALDTNPMATYRLLSACGHFLQAENPNAVFDQLSVHFQKNQTD